MQEHPEYTSDGVSLSQFSFQIPKPLRDDYVRKRPPRLPASRVTGPLKPGEGMQKKLPTSQKQTKDLPPIFNSIFSSTRVSPHLVEQSCIYIFSIFPEC